MKTTKTFGALVSFSSCVGKQTALSPLLSPGGPVLSGFPSTVLVVEADEGEKQTTMAIVVGKRRLDENDRRTWMGTRTIRTMGHRAFQIWGPRCVYTKHSTVKHARKTEHLKGERSVDSDTILTSLASRARRLRHIQTADHLQGTLRGLPIDVSQAFANG